MIEVFTVGGGEYLVNTFNALAAWSGSGGYKALVRVVMVMGFAWALLIMAWNMDAKSGLKWFMQSTLMYSVMMVPTITVKVTDRTNPGVPGAVVANVPIGIGLMAGFSSQIGDYLTRSAETVFVMPASLNYSTGGMIYGAKLLDATQGLRIDDPVFATNLNEHFKQCVFYDILLGRKTMNDLTRAPDMLAAIGPGSISLSQQFVDSSGNSQIITCNAAYTQIQSNWNSYYSAVLPKIASQFFPGVNSTLSQSKLNSDLAGVGTAGLGGAGTSAQQLIRQAMFINAMMQARDSFGNSAAQSAVDAFAQTRADIQTRNTYSTIAAGAMKWVPLLNIVLTVVFYALFPIVFLLMLMPVSGPGVAKGYITGFFYLAAWGPLFVILNMIFMSRWQSSLAGWQDGGLTAANFAGVSAINQDAGALAGYMIMSVPFIAAGMARGAMSIASHSASFLSPSQRAAEEAAQEQTTGNYAYGNTSLASRQINTLQQDQYTTAPSINMGAGNVVQRQADGTLTKYNADGTTTYDVGPGMSNLATGINVGQVVTSSLTRAISQGQANVQQKREVANEAISATANSGARLFETAQRVASSETSEGRSMQSALTETADLQRQMSDTLQNSYGISKEDSDRLATQAATTGTFDVGFLAKVAKSAGFVSGDASGGAKWQSSAMQSRDTSEGLTASQKYDSMMSYLTSTSNSEQARQSRESFQKATASSSDSELRGATEDLSANLSHSRSASQEASKAEESYQRLSEELSQLKSNSLSMSQNLTQGFVNFTTQEMLKPENAWIAKTGYNPGLSSFTENQQAAHEYMVDKFAEQHIARITGEYGSVPESLPRDISGPGFSSPKEVQQYGEAAIADVRSGAPEVRVNRSARDTALEGEVSGKLGTSAESVEVREKRLLNNNAEAGREASFAKQAVADRQTGSLWDNIALGTNFNTDREDMRIAEGGSKYSLGPPVVAGGHPQGNGLRVALQAGAALKPGVELSKTSTEMYPVFGVVATVARQMGLPQAVVTSGQDGKHGMMTGSTLHPSGKALDFRGNNISVTQGQAMARNVKAQLGPHYDVIFETSKNGRNNHLHVEYDPKPGGGGRNRAR